jgi:hypothetical protein
VTGVQTCALPIFGGWQSSHDQKYRTSYLDGSLKDIRGRKYGEDRWDEYAKGALSRTEDFVLRGLSSLAGLMFLADAGTQGLLLYNLILTLVFIAIDAYRKAHAPVERERDEEDAAHAAKFR